MHHTRDDETIIALCTPRGSGAIALLRISGVTAVSIATAMSKLPQDKLLSEQQTHTIHYGWVVDAQGQHIDQVMFFLMRAPSTFTGQDTVEITCHNNQFLIEAVIERAVMLGARLAQEGEFARRAYMQGKIDLVQAEAIDDLIHANTQFALKKSLAQVEGSFSSWIQRIEQRLIKATAWCEASFEFLDEGGDFVVEIKQQLHDILTKITQLQQSFGLQKHIRQGIRIACIGSVNVGKSSLFNKLIGQNRAIVADVAGTTRDSIECGVYRDGVYWTFIDTAGLRQTHDYIEQEGIERSKREAQQADVILLAFDCSRDLTSEEKIVYDSIMQEHAQKIILVGTKVDLALNSSTELRMSEYRRENLTPAPLTLSSSKGQAVSNKKAYEAIPISTVTGVGIMQLEQALDEKIAQLLQSHDAPFLVNKRQHQLLQRLAQNITTTVGFCNQSCIQYELIAYHLKDALEQLSELTGKSVSEAALDAVFKEFCVGK